MINQIGENENSLTLDAWLLSQKWENEISLTLDAWLLSQKWENEISLTLDFCEAKKLGFVEFYINENARKWWWWIVIMNTIFLSIKTTTTQCVCVCVCVFWDSFIVSKGLNNIFFILLNFPPPPRKIRHGY